MTYTLDECIERCEDVIEANQLNLRMLPSVLKFLKEYKYLMECVKEVTGSGDHISCEIGM